MSSFEDVLAQCLSDIETGRATVEQCLARYPEHAQSLRPLLRTALAVRTTPAVEPSASFQAAAETRMMNLIAARRSAAAQRSGTPVPAKPAHHWRPVFVKVTVAVLLACSLLGGTAYAAKDSLPDSPLYPVKRAVEQVQVAVAPGDVRKARVFVRLMDQRAIETAAMIRNGHVQRSIETTLHYNRILKAAEGIAERVPVARPEGRLFLIYMRERLLAQQAIFQRVSVNAPERARLLIRPTLQSIQRTLERIGMQLEGV